MSSTPLFDSTVAITMYNLLCQLGKPDVGVSFDELFHRATQRMHPTLKLDQAHRALQEMVRRKLLIMIEPGRFLLRDPLRRIIVDRTKTGDEAFKGMMQGGWAGWVIRSQNGPMSIDEMLEQIGDT